MADCLYPRGMGKACQLSAKEQLKIEQWTAAHGTPQQVALRCRIVSAAAAGASDVAIAQPGLPIKPGRCGTMTHDYKRNSTTTLFAALETLQGKVVGECHERHRHQEFLKFLRRLDTEFPGDVPLHLIMDNYGTHKHAKE